MSRLLIALAALTPSVALVAADEKVTFDDHVKPIFRARCFSCHNIDKKSGGLDLTNYTAMMQGGSSGDVVEPGDADLSYLWLLVTHESEPYMPPKADKLPEAELATIKSWIDGGLLENAGSTAKVSSKPTFDLGLKGAPTGRPETPPMPWRLPLDPVVHTASLDAVTAIATNPWSPLVAIAGQHQVLLYDATDARLLGVLPFPEGRAQVLRFSRNGSLLLAGGGQGASKGTVVIWNTRTGERVAEVGDELDEVLAADISADQQLVALGGPNRIVRVYSISTGEVLYSLKKHTEWITALEFSPDGVLLVTADRNGGVHVWEAFTGREYLTLKGHTKEVGSVSWRADGNILATASEDKTIKLWEMENGNAVKSWTSHNGGDKGGALSVEFARDGRLVSSGRDNTVRLWDQNGAQQRAFPAFTDVALRVSICDETNHVIAGDWTGRILGWKAADGAQVAEFSVNPPKLEVSLKAAEATLASAEADFAKLDAAAKAAEAEAARTKAALDTATAKVASDTKLVADTTAAMNAAKAEVAKWTTSKDAATKQVAAVEPLVPLLVEAHAKAAAALAKATGDAKLKALTDTAKAQVDEKSAALAAAKKAATDAGTALTAANGRVATTTKALTDANAALAAANKSVAELTPAVKAAGEKATAARAAANAAAPKRTSAKAEVDRLREAMAFAAELARLESKRTERLPIAGRVAEAEAVAKSAEAALTDATAKLTAAEKARTDATNAVNVTSASITTATSQRDAFAKTTADLTAALSPLNEAVAKANEAAAKLPGDESIKAIVTTLQGEVAAKTKALAEAKSAAEARTAEIAKLEATRAEQQKQLEGTAPVVDAARKVVAESTSARDTANAALVEARNALAAFDATLKQVEDRVQAIRNPPATGDATAEAG